MRQFLIAVLLVAAVLAVSTVQCIHEDEQGLRDWLIRTAGDVKFAAVAPVARPKLLYVASKEGAVSALETDVSGATNLTWRVIFPEEPLCVAASSRVVLAAGVSGTVLLLNPRTGAIETTFRLVGAQGVIAGACGVNEEVATVALHSATDLSIFRFEITSEEEDVKATHTLPHSGAGAVDSLRLAGTHLWVNTRDGKSAEFDVESGAKGREVRGLCASVAGSGEAVLATPTQLNSLSSPAAGAATTEQECDRCGGAVVVDAETGAYKGEAAVRTSDAGIEVAFPSGAAARFTTGPKGQRSVSNAFPLIAFTNGADTMVLVKGGNGHLMLVSEAAKGLVWERMEGLGAIAGTLIIDPPGHLDHFHFNKVVLLASRLGLLYAIPLTEMGQRVDAVVDFSAEVTKKLGTTSMRDVTVQNLGTNSVPRVVVIRASYKEATALVHIDVFAQKVLDVQVVSDALLVTPGFQISTDLSVKGAVASDSLFTYVTHTHSGLIEGFFMPANATRASPTWSVRMPYPIVAHASGNDELRTAVVNGLHVYKNMTGKETVEEVRHLYPTRNVIAVAYYEPAAEELSTLVIVAFDAITGSVLGTSRLPNVEGSVHMVVVEHAIITYFLDAAKMRYCFSVWELFQEESGPVVLKDAGATVPQIIASFFANHHRVFSSRAARPPVIVATTLSVFGGPIADMGVTTSHQAIARKSIVLAYETGRVAVIEVARLLSGGQMPMPQSTEKQITHALIFSPMLASHKYRIAFPRQITTEPTGLESSCHVVVTGLDVFYVRSSSGKPFDLLNSDFNKPLLITLVAVFAGASILVRYLVMRKTLNSLWQ